MAPADPSEYVPWNDVTNDAAARRSPPPVHLPNWSELGHALSPDGSLLATPLPGDPVHHVAIIEIATRRAWRLTYPNFRVQLSHPTFSPDGESIAFIVTPPTYFGICEIWITSIRGGSARVIASTPQRSYRNPAFSPNSTKLAYLKDVQAVPISEGRRPIRREYRAGEPHALFEIDLATRNESRIAFQAWTDIGFFAYSPDDDGFYLATNMPMRPYQRESDGAEMWNVPDYSREAYQRQSGTTGFFLPRGAEVPAEPVSLIPDAIVPAGESRTNRAVLRGVDRNRRILIDSFRAAPGIRAGGIRVASIWNGAHVEDALAPDDVFIVDPRMSLDGRTVIAPITSTNENRFLVRFPSGRIEQIRSADLAFEPAALAVEAAEHSEIAQ